MKLVAALERAPRGAYCGAVGAVRPGGDCCFNVAIRTVEVDFESGEAVYGTGGGITWDSDPAAEWDEALAKARVLDLDPGVPTLLETLRLEGGRVALLDGHLARLAGSARYHAIPLDLPAARARIEREAGDARLRLLLSPDGRLAVERSPLPEPMAGPAPVALSREPVDRSDPALFHKTTRRAPLRAAAGGAPRRLRRPARQSRGGDHRGHHRERGRRGGRGAGHASARRRAPARRVPRPPSRPRRGPGAAAPGGGPPARTADLAGERAARLGRGAPHPLRRPSRRIFPTASRVAHPRVVAATPKAFSTTAFG